MVCALGGTELDFKVLRDGDGGHRRPSQGSKQEQAPQRPSPNHIELGHSSVGKLGGNMIWGESVGGLNSEHSREKMKNPLWRTPNHEFVLSRIWSKNSYQLSAQKNPR